MAGFHWFKGFHAPFASDPLHVSPKVAYGVTKRNKVPLHPNHSNSSRLLLSKLFHVRVAHGKGTSAEVQGMPARISDLTSLLEDQAIAPILHCISRVVGSPPKESQFSDGGHKGQRSSALGWPPHSGPS